MDCAAIGDSIAVGIAANTLCRNFASIGRTAFTASVTLRALSTDTAIISLGSNSPTHPELLQDLRHVRARVKAYRVVWIVPYHKQAAEAVRRIARERSDGIIELGDFPTRDGIHPIGYRHLANAALAAAP